MEDDRKSGSDNKETKDANSKTMEKSAMVQNTMDKIAADCDDIIVFLQAFAVKAP